MNIFRYINDVWYFKTFKIPKHKVELPRCFYDQRIGLFGLFSYYGGTTEIYQRFLELNNIKTWIRVENQNSDPYVYCREQREVDAFNETLKLANTAYQMDHDIRGWCNKQNILYYQYMGNYYFLRKKDVMMLKLKFRFRPVKAMVGDLIYHIKIEKNNDE
jgi:hypothetical protein